jgi:hypothetical protein
MLLGDLDLSVDQLEIVLSKPGDLSIELIRIDPNGTG